jgi:hypothetical protein
LLARYQNKSIPNQFYEQQAEIKHHPHRLFLFFTVPGLKAFERITNFPLH